MTKRDALRNIALVGALIMGALITIIGAALYVSFVPYTLRVEVDPTTSELAQFFSALAHTLDREKAPIRDCVMGITLRWPNQA